MEAFLAVSMQRMFEDNKKMDNLAERMAILQEEQLGA